MLNGRKKQLAGAALGLALALAVWGCIGKSESPTSTKATAPAFTLQRASETVTVGQTTTFTAMATGTAPLSYQWQKNNASIGVQPPRPTQHLRQFRATMARLSDWWLATRLAARAAIQLL